MQKLEIEVKFFIKSLPELKNKLLKMGAVSNGRLLESNLRFDNEAGFLQKTGALLRLRKIGAKNIVTVKQRVDCAAALEYKALQELEVEVLEYDTTKDIFAVLGFKPVMAYEKYREALVLPDAYFDLDETPCGSFLEIEADAGVIRKYANVLGLDWSQRIVLSYVEIFTKLKAAHNLPFNEMTFENFKKLNPPVTADSILSEIVAG